MEVFDDDIAWLRSYLASKRAQGRDVRVLESGAADRRYRDFLRGDGATIVLREETWVELGSSATASAAPVLVTERLDLVADGAITLIGPDVPEARGSLPFAQILLIASSELRDEDYRKISSFQYQLELAGYMIKAVPSSLSLWSRVSKESAAGGFSFGILGRAITEKYKSAFSIASMEIVFVTTSREDVEELEGLRRKITRILGAMNKMIEETSFDCSTCAYLDVCSDVRKLGALRERLMRERRSRGIIDTTSEEPP